MDKFWKYSCVLLTSVITTSFVPMTSAAAQTDFSKMIVSDFLASCEKDNDWCRGEIAEEAWRFDDFRSDSKCLPASITDTALANPVWLYLRSTPDAASSQADAVVDDAVNAIWPCPPGTLLTDRPFNAH